eukprot:CAMPEP_0114250802 /NCGR_PEP_ID=MMETSP0058-20121206/14902_1 /TAXON_ID=36894 /ORGANISM="Pyramimonas parkeae, CCMP726" /LENGTH=245 /DNA_ID=CAMNT_0001364503 /DNA_START=60 /DNA_END=797 /DNA_ORIENTATION=+
MPIVTTSAGIPRATLRDASTIGISNYGPKSVARTRLIPSRMQQMGVRRSFNPNDPMTWTQPLDGRKYEPEESSDLILSKEEVNQLLSTPMGTSPTSPEGAVVIKAAMTNMELADAPEDAREAIARGIEMTSQQNYEAGLSLFQKALTLPGSGVKRNRIKPQELTEGEQVSALYNIACCHAQMGDTKQGLDALAQAINEGFEDFAVARTDPDLAPLREEAQFEGLLARSRSEETGKGILNFIGKLF